MLLQPVNLRRTGFAYKLRSFLRKLLLANCPSFTSQVRTDLMSTLHLQSHVSSLSQSWTNFLFTTAPCRKASFFFPPSTYSFNFCWRCPWIHSVSGTFRHHSEIRLSLQSRGQSLPPPQQGRLTTQLSRSQPILYRPCSGWPGEGTLSLEGPCREGSDFSHPGGRVPANLCIFLLPFPSGKPSASR